MINLGCIDLNPWNSRIRDLDRPDYLVLDLDPESLSFEYVIEAALAVKEVLDELGIVGYPKTSGATGMHIYLPMGAKYTYQHVVRFGEILVNLAHRKVSKLTSLRRSPSERRGKVYL